MHPCHCQHMCATHRHAYISLACVHNPQWYSTLFLFFFWGGGGGGGGGGGSHSGCVTVQETELQLRYIRRFIRNQNIFYKRICYYKARGKKNKFISLFTCTGTPPLPPSLSPPLLSLSLSLSLFLSPPPPPPALQTPSYSQSAHAALSIYIHAYACEDLGPRKRRALNSELMVIHVHVYTIIDLIHVPQL